MYHVPAQRPHRFTVAPTTPLGKWAVGLVAALLALVVAVVTVVPGDTLAAWLVAAAGFALAVAAGVVSFTAIFRRSERALSVYAAGFVLVGGVLFLLLHSLFISD